MLRDEMIQAETSSPCILQINPNMSKNKISKSNRKSKNGLARPSLKERNDAFTSLDLAK